MIYSVLLGCGDAPEAEIGILDIGLEESGDEADSSLQRLQSTHSPAIRYWPGIMR